MSAGYLNIKTSSLELKTVSILNNEILEKSFLIAPIRHSDN